MDLIESMISLDFKNRISAKAALKHQFFQENPHACEPSEVLPQEIRNPAPDTDYHEFITKNEKNKK
jgi:serine/threonine protein kinase